MPALILMLPLLAKIGGVLVLLGGLWAGWAYYRHSVWVEGRDAALEAVAKQNEVAKQAAQGVRSETDRCFDEGGSWDVSTGSCDRD